MKVAVLAYHSQNVNGSTYATNDHIALATDLSLIRQRGIPVLPLGDLVATWLGPDRYQLPPAAIALTCDDGTLLDWEPFDHPSEGIQTSFREIVATHAREAAVSAKGMLTSFVIASPDARREIDTGCYAGYPLSDERWWAEAQREGTIDIENHSWDHVHACVSVVAQSEQRKGDFAAISTWQDADLQIRRSADYIDRALSTTGHATSLFAYPYGHVNRFLIDEYFPGCMSQHRVRAAFADRPAFWTEESHRYEIPRFVCGLAWRSPEEFSRILDRASADR